jgi:anaerobic magnesium-protoporphyrin IX monomethyl ester cyclase
MGAYKMRVYFLNPPYFPHFGRGMRWQDTGRGGTLYYPIWLAYATGVVGEQHTVRLVDAPARGWERKEVINDILSFKPDLLVTDSSFPSLDNDIEVANTIKKTYEVPVCLVGPPASKCADRILDRGLDFVARWEYDYTLLELANALESRTNLMDITGLSYRESYRNIHNPDRDFTTSEDLDKMPFVSQVYKEHLEIRDYFLGSSLYPEIQIFTGRGCPYQCTFCSWPQTLMGRKYRRRSVPNIIKEFQWIEDNLDINEVFFEDDTFTIDNKRVIDFCTAYKKAGLSLSWACNARATLDYETMLEMKKANCRLVIVGYESGSDSILKNIKKGITVEQNRRFAQDAKKADLLVHGDFIIGLPGETLATIAQTEALLYELKPDILQVAIATPFPGSEFYQWSRSEGYLKIDNPALYLDGEGHQRAIIAYPGLPPEEISNYVDKILKRYYFSLNYIPIAVHQILRHKGKSELQRLFYSMQMFLRYSMRKTTTASIPKEYQNENITRL